MCAIVCHADLLLKDEPAEDVKMRLGCTTVHKREEEDQVYDYR